MKVKQKKGISLIVLVITIIVMIILAAAIILSLNSSGVISKANGAVDKSDRAMTIERVNTEIAEAQLQLVTNENAWNMEVAEGFESGSGTESDPYIIKNAEQLAYLSKIVNEGDTCEGKYFKITEFINLGNMQWNPMGGKAETGSDFPCFFNGTLDGQDNTIGNLNIDLPEYNGIGLIGCLGDKGVVKNLKIVTGNVVGKAYVGAIAGVSFGKIINCVNTANILAKDQEGVSMTGVYPGGIAGYVESGSITQCINKGSVTALSKYAADNTGYGASGIVGCLYGGAADATVEDCINYGTINTGYWVAGGIVGETWGATSNSYIINCDNYGEVIVDSSFGGAYGGGITGHMIKGTITGCNNYANVTVSRQMVGGIVAYMQDGLIENCSNSGSILCKASNILGIAGGIVGRMTKGNVNIAYNSGTVETYEYTSGIDKVGGIIGFMEAGTVDKSYNTGTIKGNGKTASVETSSGVAVGAVVGQGITGVNITNCYYKEGISPRGIGSLSSSKSSFVAKADAEGVVKAISNNILNITEWNNWLKNNA